MLIHGKIGEENVKKLNFSNRLKNGNRLKIAQKGNNRLAETSKRLKTQSESAFISFLSEMSKTTGLAPASIIARPGPTVKPKCTKTKLTKKGAEAHVANGKKCIGNQGIPLDPVMCDLCESIMSRGYFVQHHSKPDNGMKSCPKLLKKHQPSVFKVQPARPILPSVHEHAQAAHIEDPEPIAATEPVQAHDEVSLKWNDLPQWKFINTYLTDFSDGTRSKECKKTDGSAECACVAHKLPPRWTSPFVEAPDPLMLGNSIDNWNRRRVMICALWLSD